MGYLSLNAYIWKKEKSQISNLARDDHTEWSQRKTNIIWYHLYVEYNINDTERTKLSDFKTNLMVTTGKNHCGERGIGSVGITYTPLYTRDD